jgi:CRP-like cAMP-binding protein
MGTSLAQNGNQFLDAVSPDTRDRLHPHLELVRLIKGRQLLDAGDPIRHAMFPVNGFLSVLALTESGESVEVATIGAECFAGHQLLLGVKSSDHRLVAPISGSAYRVSADVIRREAQRNPQFQQDGLRCAGQVMFQISRAAVCLTFHPLAQRAAKWLLIYSERSRSTTIELTHEFIAQLLGASRPRVSEALMMLESRRLIHQGLARIHIVNRSGLEEAACECVREPLPYELPS